MSRNQLNQEKETVKQPLPWKIRVENEARRKIQDLEVALADANRALFDFREAHMICIGTQLYFKTGDITGRAELDRKWHALVTKRDTLLREWNLALQEFAEVKTS